jgi:LuxR family maltose regulon positive regulatory protein
MRIFLDESAPLEALLRLALGKKGQADYVRRILAAFGQPGETPPAKPKPSIDDLLSERELEVLRLVATGAPNKQIAAELVIALGTVKRHTVNIFNKLGVDNRTQAIAKAREMGLV